MEYKPSIKEIARYISHIEHKIKAANDQTECSEARLQTRDALIEQQKDQQRNKRPSQR